MVGNWYVDRHKQNMIMNDYVLKLLKKNDVFEDFNK